MTADEIKDQIIQKQDELIKYFKSSYYHDSIAFRYGNFFFSRKVKKIEKKLASLRQQLEKSKATKLSIPLDVPTDKEIEGEAMSYSSYPAMPDGHPEFNIIQANDFDAGAKWAIKQIIERNQK